MLKATDTRHVFISYAHNDGVELTQRLDRDLRLAGFDVWHDARRLVGGASWTAEIEAAIDRCDVLLAVMTSGSYVSELCRAEQLRALRKGCHVIPLLAQSTAEIPLYLEAKQYRDFERTYDLPALLGDIQSRRNGVDLRPRFRETYVTAPPLPRNYVDRPDEVARLRDSLLAEGSGVSIALTALKGMGGIGKTILAQALARDEVVQAAFPDGVLWATVGKEAGYDLRTRMSEVRRGLGDMPGDAESDLECVNRYRTALRTKAALVIVDDVWRKEDIEPFIAESARSRLLFTTRDGSIAAAVGADEHRAGLLSNEKAQELLARWAGLNTTDLPHEAWPLISECGRLPLALSMVGAMLRGKPLSLWPRVLERIQHAELDHFRSVAGYQHGTLMRAIDISIDGLQRTVRERYLRLAVILEDMAVHPAIQQTLWGVGAGEAVETAESLVDRSLATREADQSLRLHDLQLDYLRTQWEDKESLALIHGALRLSAHVIERDPSQFAGQMIGRLLPWQDAPCVAELIKRSAHGPEVPWLHPLRPGLHPPGTALLRTLAGHVGPVLGAIVTPDGRCVVSCSADKTVRVWDLESGRELYALHGHHLAVNSVAVTSDSCRMVSASDDGTLRVWDLKSGQEMSRLQRQGRWITDVAITAAGGLAVSASSDGTLKVWNLESGQELRTLTGHSDYVCAVSLTPDGRQAVSASLDRTLKVWDLESGHEVCTLGGHTQAVYDVAVTPDGSKAVSASEDNTLKVWDISSGRTLRTLNGHSGAVYGVAVTQDGQHVVSASNDQTIKLWELQSGLTVRTLQGHSDSVRAVSLAPRGRVAVSASDDHTLKIWDLKPLREPRIISGHSSAVFGVAVSRDGRLALSASADSLKTWDVQSGREIRSSDPYDLVFGIRADPVGSRAVFLSWDMADASEFRSEGYDRWRPGSALPIRGTAITADGRWVVSVSHYNTLTVWDLHSTHKSPIELDSRASHFICESGTLYGHTERVNDVAVTLDGTRAVTASDDHTLRVWHLESRRALLTLYGHSSPVRGVAAPPGGERVLSASQDCTIKLWDLQSGREVGTLHAHSAAVNVVAVTTDGRFAVSASDDKTVRVWDLGRQTSIAVFTCDAAVKCCAVLGNDLVIAGDAGGHVHFLVLEHC